LLSPFLLAPPTTRTVPLTQPLTKRKWRVKEPWRECICDFTTTFEGSRTSHTRWRRP
jgi:hypothetical protein